MSHHDSALPQVFRDGETDLPMTVIMSRLHLHLSTGHRWRQSKQLDCFRIGGRWFVSRAAWDRFIARCNPSPEPSTADLRSRTQREAELARAKAELHAAGF
jgi:hypothetical protein